MCDRAREQLPAFVDGELAGEEARLVAMHLGTCAGCRRLEATLAALAAELPKLADEEPDLRFTRDVMAATSERRSVAWTWVATRFSAWSERPRFAMEAAYIGVLVLMLVLGAFSTPVAALPQKGVELMQSESTAPSIWTRADEGLGTFWQAVASMFEKVEKKPEANVDADKQERKSSG